MSEPEVINRRVPEGYRLREFFQEQWSWFLEHFDRRHQTQSALDASPQLADAIESIVDGTDKRIRIIQHYQEQLREAARQVIQHIEQITAQLAPVIAINRQSYSAHPLVHHLFISRQELFKVFAHNELLQHFFSELQHLDLEQVYCLLLVTAREKSTLGSKLVGEIMMREVRRQTMHFTGHLVLYPSRDATEVQSRLKTYLFNNCIAEIKSHLLSIERSQSAAAQRRHANPTEYLDNVVQLLRRPERWLWLEPRAVSVDSLGFVADQEESGTFGEHQLQFQELHLGHQTQRLLMVVTYPRQEMQTHENFLEAASHLYHD